MSSGLGFSPLRMPDTFLAMILNLEGDRAYLGRSIRPPRSLVPAGGMYSAAPDAK